MSVKLYDDALIAKIKNWFTKTDIQIYSPEDTRSIFEYNGDITNDKPLKLPIISISRNGLYNVTVPTIQPLAYDGITLDKSIEKSLQLNAIPISISYSISVLTRYFQEADELCRNLIFNLIKFPELDIVMKYNDVDFMHKATLTLSPTIVDNSSVPERLIKGQFTKLRLDVNIENAYLWDIRYRDNYDIEVDVNLE